MTLEKNFFGLLSKYTTDQNLKQKLWTEIERNYSSKKRHYHTLSHLEDISTQLDEIRKKLNDREVILFTLYYHDAIYDARKTDNEERSAALAMRRMEEIGVPEESRSKCAAQIIATKSHQKSPDSDTNLFTDADLSILGRPWDDYEAYFKKIRKEYSIYPDFLYKPVRNKVLAHFLALEKIFKTNIFHSKFELSAKANIARELAHLEN